MKSDLVVFKIISSVFILLLLLLYIFCFLAAFLLTVERLFDIKLVLCVSSMIQWYWRWQLITNDRDSIFIDFHCDAQYLCGFFFYSQSLSSSCRCLQFQFHLYRTNINRIFFCSIQFLWSISSWFIFYL